MKRRLYYPAAKVAASKKKGVLPYIIIVGLAFIWVFALLLAVKPVKAANPIAALAIEVVNQRNNQGQLQFDLVLRQQGPKEIYLGPSDIVIQLDEAAQDVQRLSNSSLLFSRSGLMAFAYDGLINQRIQHKDGIAYVVINVDAPFFEDEEDFEYQVAEIDARKGLHRLGSFVISGISPDFSLNNAQLAYAPGARSAIMGFDLADAYRLKPVSAELLAEASSAGNPIFSLDVQVQSAAIHISWKLGAEPQSIALEKSFDNKYWEAVDAPVQNQGNGWYRSIDQNPLGARQVQPDQQLYYRLRVQYQGKAYYAAAKGVNYQRGIEFSIYPNPVSDLLHIKLNNGQLAQYQLEIFNSEGRLVVREQGYEANALAVDVSYLAAGQYYVRLYAGSEQGYSKMLVLR
jgi:hypothetical protein